MQEAESVRRSLYVLFARLLAGPPDRELYLRLRNEGLRQFAEVQGIDLLSDLVDEEDAESSATELAAEHSRLDARVSLRASDYGGASGDPVVAISAFLTEHGLVLDNDDLPPDHLAVVLAIMGELAGQAESGEEEPCLRARSFFLRHIAPWAQQALADLSENADRLFYRGLSAMVSAFLGSEQREYSAA